jgi:hypothetical protein
LREERNFFGLGNFYKEYERYEKKLEEVRLLGLLTEKGNAYRGSSSVDPEDIKSSGAIWNFRMEQGSLS